ncbi:MAG: hypothetical protein AAF389_12890 [Gemmatimonadota bacterium]
MSEALDVEIRTLQTIYWSERDPDGLAFAPLADAFLRKGDVREALTLLNDGTSRHPDFTTGHVVAARLYHSQGMNGEAEFAARRVLELDPGNLLALSTLSSILEDGEGEDEAASVRSALVDTDPGSEEARAVAHLVDSTGDDAPTEVDEEEQDFSQADTVERLPALGAVEHDAVLELDGEEAGSDEDEDAAGLAAAGLAAGAGLAAAGLAAAGVFETGYEEQVLDLDALAPSEPDVAEADAVDFDALAPDPEPEFTDLAALAPDEPVLDLDALAPAEAVVEDTMDLSALAPDEPVMDLDALAPVSTEDELDAVDFASLAPDPEPEFTDLAALAPDEPVIDLDALAPAEPVSEVAMELAALAPDEPVMELDALAPSEPVVDDAMDLAMLAPDEPVVDLDALAPIDPAAEATVELAALAPDEPVMELGALAPDLPSDEGQNDPPAEESASMLNDEPIPTRTLAELYTKQGFTEKALAMYRTLADSEPDAQDLRDRIAELEQGGPGAATGEHGGAPTEPDGPSEEEVEALARDLADAGSAEDEVDSPFAWTPDETPEPDRGDIGRYFDSMLDWNKGE